MAVLVNPPCVVFEDDHLLVVGKPPGWNTHSPAPYAGEGIYEWLKNREQRWAKLAIIHRLDKETSGLLLFSKTPEANRSLTQQFTEGKVRKEYILETIYPPPKPKFTVRSTLVRVGERYASQRGSTSGAEAETEFELLETRGSHFKKYVILARPHTGRTHQIRVHAAENGFPISGDALYGGAPNGGLHLHARRLQFKHPSTGESLDFNQSPAFDTPPWLHLRRAFIDTADTDAYRHLHGAADGFADFHVDRFGPYVLSQSPKPLTEDQSDLIYQFFDPSGLYHKITTPHVRGKTGDEANPQHIADAEAQGPFTIRENGVNYEINFAEGYSVGIFLDQRDNRRRILTNYIAPDFFVCSQTKLHVEPPLKGAEVLNTFAYTCAFSVCAALAGARVTSLDLSKKYLDWGRRNFQLNTLDPAEHDFIYGDVFDWLKRLGKKQRQFDVVLLDPPTFSKSKQSGLFRVEHDYSRLVIDALKVLKPGGVLFASSNAARWAPEDFVRQVRQAVAEVGREIAREHYVPQPPDFPISKTAPAYLKTLWLQVA
jgi:23S rRNA (cytosine1962-C5)-methyltransferase